MELQWTLKPPQRRTTAPLETVIMIMGERLGRSWLLLVTFIHLSQFLLHLWCGRSIQFLSSKYSHVITQSSSPHPSAATFPANWIKIPQRSYDYGRKQFDFKRLDPISFSTKDHPGINLGDALRKNCTRLNGKSDPMVQAASRVASCRLLVRSCITFRPK